MQVVILTVYLFAALGGLLALPLRESIFDMIEERSTGKVRFFLYSRDNPKDPVELFIGDVLGVKQSHFKKSHQTKVLIHGWGGTYKSSPNPTTRDAYLERGEFNIISIDWNPFAKLNYVSARNKVPLVGEDVAEFLDFLHDEFELDYSALVVIGHSLGSHVAGYTGKLLKRGKLAAIVGMDPAFPLYSHDNPETRLADTDANYVQTIQTNGQELGFYKPIGSAAFYPNWGRYQVGCGPDITGSCSHGRSVSYYVEAIRGYTYAPIFKCSGFESIQAEDPTGCAEFATHARMGDPLLVQRVEGIYYFQTNSQKPYGNLYGRDVLT